MSDSIHAFRPILRFAVCSDIHMHTRGDERAERLRRLIRLAYDRAAQDDAYTSLDALAVCGDLTDFGAEAMVTDFWQVIREELQPGTQFLSVLAKCHDNWGEGESRENPKTGLAYYRDTTGQPTSFCRIIGGCAFIGISTSEETGVYYDDGQREWLRRTLDTVSAQIPDKPIFVLQHEPICGTVYGSMPAGATISFRISSLTTRGSCISPATRTIRSTTRARSGRAPALRSAPAHSVMRS